MVVVDSGSGLLLTYLLTVEWHLKVERTADSKVAGSAAESLDARRDAVVNVLEKTLDKYATEFADIEDKPNPYTAPPIWELRDYILPALGSLITAAQSVRDDEGTL
jgi:hypothetical protein